MFARKCLQLVSVFVCFTFNRYLLNKLSNEFTYWNKIIAKIFKKSPIFLFFLLTFHNVVFFIGFNSYLKTKQVNHFSFSI